MHYWCLCSYRAKRPSLWWQWRILGFTKLWGTQHWRLTSCILIRLTLLGNFLVVSSHVINIHVPALLHSRTGSFLAFHYEIHLQNVWSLKEKVVFTSLAYELRGVCSRWPIRPILNDLSLLMEIRKWLYVQKSPLLPLCITYCNEFPSKVSFHAAL